MVLRCEAKPPTFVRPSPSERLWSTPLNPPSGSFRVKHHNITSSISIFYSNHPNTSVYKHFTLHTQVPNVDLPRSLIMLIPPSLFTNQSLFTKFPGLTINETPCPLRFEPNSNNSLVFPSTASHPAANLIRFVRWSLVPSESLALGLLLGSQPHWLSVGRIGSQSSHCSSLDLGSFAEVFPLPL